MRGPDAAEKETLSARTGRRWLSTGPFRSVRGFGGVEVDEMYMRRPVPDAGPVLRRNVVSNRGQRVVSAVLPVQPRSRLLVSPGRVVSRRRGDPAGCMG